MTPVPSARWSTLDLELYRDGELAGERRGALSESLRDDPDLRDRLAAVERVDLVSCDAFAVAPSRVRVRHAIPSIAAAAVLCICLAGVFIATRERPSPVRSSTSEARTQQSPLPADTRGFRIAFSIPLKIRHPSTPQIPSPSEPAAVADLVDLALADGQGAEATSLLVSGRTPERDAVYRRLGESIKTAQAAREAIAGLSDPEKLEIARVWSADPRLVPIAFSMLSDLSMSPDVKPGFDELVSRLRADPRLRGYVLSYLPGSGASGS